MIIKEKPEDFIVNEVISLNKNPDGDFFYFKLTKTDRNLIPLINTLAKKLRINRNDISFAGTKDRKAITSQWISIYKANPKKVLNLDLEGVEIDKSFFRGDSPINLGDLEGNEFKIKIDFIPKNLSRIVNYFGPQRFSKNNSEIGKAILKRNYRLIPDLISDRVFEENLQEHPTDILRALKKLDKKIISLYIHSYQSYLWNKVVKKIKDKKIEVTPLFSFDAKFKNKDVEDEYLSLLAKENITKKDFILKDFPELTPMYSERLVHVPLKNFKFSKPFVSFFLPKGSYATTALNQMK